MAKDTKRDCVGQRIYDLMKEKGITQKELSGDLGWDKKCQTINKILQVEDGTTKSGRTIQRMKQIADYFNVSLDWLYCRSNIKNNALVGKEGYITKISNSLGLDYRQLHFITGAVWDYKTEIPTYIKALLKTPYTSDDELECFLHSIIEYLEYEQKNDWIGYDGGLLKKSDKVKDIVIDDIDIKYILICRVIESLNSLKDSSFYNYESKKNELSYVNECLKILQMIKEKKEYSIHNEDCLHNDVIKLIEEKTSENDSTVEELINSGGFFETWIDKEIERLKNRKIELKNIITSIEESAKEYTKTLEKVRPIDKEIYKKMKEKGMV